jgi:hypothetical protein
MWCTVTQCTVTECTLPGLWCTLYTAWHAVLLVPCSLKFSMSAQLYRVVAVVGFPAVYKAAVITRVERCDLCRTRSICG